MVFWNCSDSMVFVVFLFYFRIVPTVWYLLFFLFYFRTVPTVWYFRTFPDSVVFFLLHFLIFILTSLHLYGNITILFNHNTVVLEIIKYLINSSIYAYLVYICNLNSFEIIQLFKHIYYIKISDYLEIKIRRVPHVEQ